MLGHFPGRRIRDALHLHRLPGLVPGSSGRRIRLVLHPHRHPGLAPGPYKKAEISKQPRWTPQKVLNPIPNNEL